MKKKSDKKFSALKILLLSVLVIFVLSIGFLVSFVSYLKSDGRADLIESSANDTLSEKLPDSLVYFHNFLKASTRYNPQDSLKIVHVSNELDTVLYKDIDKLAGKKVRRVFSGKRINIAITGVDSRLGSRYKHADANHVISIIPDSARIEIISIPRDTEIDCGFPDSTNQNKITVMRAAKGQKEYLKGLAEIAELDRIHYHVEFGFSQAMGILEWLGYEDSGEALQILRSRTALGGNDFQRVYNQAQFMKQMIFRHWKKFDGLFSDVLISGGLSMVDTDLSTSKVNEIISKLKENSFPKSEDDIVVYVKPPIRLAFKVYDFSNPDVLIALKNKISTYNEEHKRASDTSKIRIDVAGILNKELDRAVQDTAKHPTLVVNRLKVYFDQRAWLQVHDLEKRESIRNRFKILLSDAYIKKKNTNKAYEINKTIEQEKELFRNKLNAVDGNNQGMIPETKDTLAEEPKEVKEASIWNSIFN